MISQKKLEKINSELGELRAGFYKTNLKFKGEKAELDVLKFKLESANLKGGNESDVVRKEYKEKSSAFNELKVIKEQFEIDIGSRRKKKSKSLKADIKAVKDERDKILQKS